MGYGPLEGLIKESSKEYENIYFHPAVPPDELLDFTSSADFGILFYENNCLNHYYCSPNKMFEYLMAGIPVLVSNLYEMKNLVEQYQIGIVATSNSVKGFTKSIEESLNQDYLRIVENVEKSRKLFCWEEQEKVLLDVYKEFS